MVPGNLWTELFWNSFWYPHFMKGGPEIGHYIHFWWVLLQHPWTSLLFFSSFLDYNMTVTTVHSANFIGLFVLVLPFQRTMSSSLFSSVLIWGFFFDLKRKSISPGPAYINCEYGGDFSLLVWVVLSGLSFLVIWRVVLIDQWDSWDPHCYKACWQNMQRQRSRSSWHAAMSEPTCGKNVRIPS